MKAQEVAAIPRMDTAVAAAPAANSEAVRADTLALIRASLDDDKAEDLVVIDLAGKSTIADHMVIASGRSHRQVGAMAEHVQERLKAAGCRGVSVEGLAHCDWVLLDVGNVIVHLFRPEVRAFYGLEKMWGEVPGEGGRSPVPA